MQLMIDGDIRTFVPIAEFRAQHQLPPEFGIALFEPKDYTGLGRIDRAGAALNSVRQTVLEAMPGRMTVHGWLTFAPELQRLFHRVLYSINPQVGLKDVEVDFAVAGFGDVCQALAYALVYARAEKQPPPTFPQIYRDWLNSSVRVLSTVYHYEHQGQGWQVQLVSHAYGRAGLVVRTGQNIYYVQDTSLACPAEGFMESLLRDVAERVLAATMADFTPNPTADKPG